MLQFLARKIQKSKEVCSKLPGLALEVWLEGFGSELDAQCPKCSCLSSPTTNGILDARLGSPGNPILITLKEGVRSRLHTHGAPLELCLNQVANKIKIKN